MWESISRGILELRAVRRLLLKEFKRGVGAQMEGGRGHFRTGVRT